MIAVLQLVSDTLDAIAVLHKRERITQALILLYSAIDTFAWLGSPDDRVTGPMFKKWVDQYLLPGTALECNAADLYSARCGLLHTHSAESTTSAAGKARQIWYWTGEHSRAMLHYHRGDRQDVVFVRVADLIEAFVTGVERFAAVLSEDDLRLTRAEEKATHLMAWVPAPPAV